MTSKFACFWPGFFPGFFNRVFKVGLPKKPGENPPGFFGYVPGCPNPVYRRDPQKALPCTETHRLSHKAWKSVHRFDLGAGSRKKRTGHDRTVKKVTNALYFTYLGRSPHWTDFHKNLHSTCRPRRNHVSCSVLSCPFFLHRAPRSNRWTDFHALWLKRRFSEKTHQVRRKTFTLLYDKFTEDNMYQILSQSVRFCRLYIKKTFWCFFRFTV